MRAVLLVLVASVVLNGCSLLDGRDGPEHPPLNQLMGAPDTLSLGSQRLVLETTLWRDFQPISPPDGKPLVAIFRVTSIDSSALDEALDGDAAWLILDGNVWGAYFSDEDPPPSEQLPYQLFKVARDGPKWGPGVTVTAVLRLRDADGSCYLVRASQQYISRTS